MKVAAGGGVVACLNAALILASAFSLLGAVPFGALAGFDHLQRRGGAVVGLTTQLAIGEFALLCV